MSAIDYWKECISSGADECGLKLTDEQLKCLAESTAGGHDNYGMAFYAPPSSDRLHDIEREWKAKLEAKDRELERYRTNAETAIKQALNQRPEALVSIGECGEVTRYDGRTEVIQ